MDTANINSPLCTLGSTLRALSFENHHIADMKKYGVQQIMKALTETERMLDLATALGAWMLALNNFRMNMTRCIKSIEPANAAMHGPHIRTRLYGPCIAATAGDKVRFGPIR